MAIAFFRGKTLRVCALLTVVVLSTSGSRPANADQSMEQLAKRVGVRILADATSDKSTMNGAKTQLPFHRMSERSRNRANDILRNLSQYRRMPCLQYEVDPNIYQYLVNHPDVGVSTWRVMQISTLQMFQTGPFEYEASASDGSTGSADVLWRDANQCVFVVEGTYRSPMLPGAIEASALVWLRYRFIDGGDGKVMVNQQVETFITFPSGAIETLARLASVVTNTILDRNVFEVSLYARMMSKAAQKDPEWVDQLAQRMDGVLPKRRTELARICRGQSITEGKALPTVTKSAQRPVAQNELRPSGEFREFKTSLHSVNQHVPLVAAEVQHKPSYGKSIGSGHPAMARPPQYLTPEAKRAVAAQEERNRRTQQYNAWYARPNAKGVPNVTAPIAVPPMSAMQNPTPISRIEPAEESSALSMSATGAEKAASRATTSAPTSHPERAETSSPKNRVNAKSVSSAKTVRPSGANPTAKTGKIAKTTRNDDTADTAEFPPEGKLLPPVE